MKTLFKTFTFSLFVILTFVFIACGGAGSGKDAEPINFKAKLNSDYYSAGKGRASLSNLKIVAVPINGFYTYIKEDGISHLVEKPIESDGSFNLDLPKTIEYYGHDNSYDYIILVVDESKPPKDKVVSFVSMSDLINISKISLGGLGSINTIVKLPISASKEDIDAGTLSLANENEALSTSSTGGDFSLSDEQLQIIAKSDDVTKFVKNDYLNQEMVSITSYNWTDTIGTNFDSLKADFSDPNLFKFDGAFITLMEKSGAEGYFGSYNSIKDNIIKIGLYPPSDVTRKDGLKTYNSTTPITNEAALTGDDNFCNDNDFSLYASNPGSGLSFCSSSETGGLTSLPSGEWILRKAVNNEALNDLSPQIGSFDFAVGNPFVTNESALTTLTSKIKIYVPAIKISVDASDIITLIEIKWYLWNGTSYQQVEDYSEIVRSRFIMKLGIYEKLGASTTFVYRSPDKTSYTSSDLANPETGGPVKLSNVSFIDLNLTPGIVYFYNFKWSVNP